MQIKTLGILKLLKFNLIILQIFFIFIIKLTNFSNLFIPKLFLPLSSHPANLTIFVFSCLADRGVISIL